MMLDFFFFGNLRPHLEHVLHAMAHNWEHCAHVFCGITVSVCVCQERACVCVCVKREHVCVCVSRESMCVCVHM